MRPALLAALAMLAAGCAGAPPPPGPQGPPEPPLISVPPPPPGDGNGTALPTTRELVFYLTPDHALALAPPSAGTVPDTFGFTGVGAQTGGTPPPWVSPPLQATHRLTAARLDLWLSSAAPQPATSPTLGLEPVNAWYGPAPGGSPRAAFPGPATLGPEGAHVEGELPLARGGLVVEQGQELQVMFFFGYAQGEGNPVLVHVGGETASRLTFTAEPYLPLGGGQANETQHMGTFAASTFVLPNPDPAERERSFPVSIHAWTTRLEATLTLAPGAVPGQRDLDLVLLDPAGELVWGSTTPRADEAFTLHAVNFLQEGDYTLQVQNFQSVQGDFVLTVRQHEV